MPSPPGSAWIRLARAPSAPHVPASALTWWTLSAIFQTLALPLVFVIVFLQPQAFSSLLAHAPYSTLVLAVAMPVLVLLLLWRVFVELTRTLPAGRLGVAAPARRAPDPRPAAGVRAARLVK